MKEKLLEIYTSTCTPLYKVLDGISAEQLNWNPASESRSISGIIRHLLRVDNSFLKKLGREPAAFDPGNVPAHQIEEQLKIVHKQMGEMVRQCKDENELYMISSVPGAKETDNIYEYVIHSSQHNLYHLAQVIYLRRALDRQWQSPIDDWDKATRLIAHLGH